MQSKKIEIKIDCKKCEGSGLFHNFYEDPEGVMQVCNACDGKGYQEISFMYFNKKKKLNKVKKIVVRGCNLGGGIVEKEISYEEFLKTGEFNLYNL